MTDRMMHIRTYLNKKSKTELVDLLVDLVQGMDEPTRQRFWGYLAPPGMTTADLRYLSAKDFLVKLESFAEEVSEGKFYDEEAAAYYGEDNYDDLDEYDPDDHTGLKVLRVFFHEADSYFDAGQFEVARQAYEMLLNLVLDETDETLGIPDPMQFLSQNQHQVVRHYFTALLRFLSGALPQMLTLPRSVALERSETIYRRLMQTHIDNGRKTYNTAAYYCALLAEIAYHENRLEAFKHWYKGFMESYKRFRALRAEMDKEVGPVLLSRQ